MGDCIQGRLGTVMSRARVWLGSHYLTFAASGTTTLPADLWLDCRGWRDAWVMVEYTGTNAASLTVTLETAPGLSSSEGPWQAVSGASTTMDTNPAVLKASAEYEVPPMGLLRLEFAASAALTGSVRVLVLFKREA
jgi:hypothetical protein